MNKLINNIIGYVDRNSKKFREFQIIKIFPGEEEIYSSVEYGIILWDSINESYGVPLLRSKWYGRSYTNFNNYGKCSMWLDDNKKDISRYTEIVGDALLDNLNKFIV